jgi:hypothetical protein
MNRFRAVAAALLLVLAALPARADSVVQDGMYGYANRNKGLATRDPGSGAIAPGMTPYTSDGQPVSNSNPLPVNASISVNAPTSVAPVASSALESGHVLKASAGDLLGFQANYVTCSTFPCWVLVLDAAALPANGNVSSLVRASYQMGASSTLAVGYAPGPPLRFSTGITIACSSTGPFTFTALAQCAISGQVQ